ncbi:MAG: UDP-N-acetylglucosamine 2-epimerase (non-hydrolyzing) [Bacteroidetes bacterium]|nr:UDP-N-acetylglucosamine 2-epimerase (non-hydrolyzing) [Rhodothermia bacterium]MCX7906766.1 UDP-N-acetylglucosamine 2-epimerase (non-hydrolyzing) [Bacteroidota bacterium]MDW8285175.1 UDP-N-acetylglucosamine 2-epimerase (non-hydrolyzing) [Bacteroidota bacterium]
MKRVLVILGTRPEVIKLGPVIQALARHPQLEPIVCFSGQHQDLVVPLLPLFGIRITYELKPRRRDAGLAAFGGEMMHRLARLFRRLEPDMLLVQGDTTTAALAGLAAFYEGIPVAHIEAGLRTYNRWEPFPEEVNRRLLAEVSTLHFAPTQQAVLNLIREGVPENRIWLTGNTAIDALRWVRRHLGPVERPEEPLVLVTAHRRENWGDGLRRIGRALRWLARRHAHVRFVVPLHPNPIVQQALRPWLERLPNVDLRPAVSYVEMVRLLDQAHVVLTDSGGLQEEAAYLGKPILVLRHATERPEGVQAGVAQLVGTSPRKIIAWTERLLTDPAQHRAMSRRCLAYGDGRASERIVRALAAYLYGLELHSERSSVALSA